MKRLSKILKVLNFKTIYFNFSYLPFKDAIRFPFLIASKVYLKNLKGKVVLQGPVRFGMVKIGLGDIGIFDHLRARGVWDVSGEVVFNGSANIGHGAKISVGPSGVLELGDNFQITAETSIACHHQITFGADCLLSWETLIMDTDFHPIEDQNGQIINPPQPIIVQDRVWIGCRCTILKGSFIASRSVVGANSVVAKKLEKENALYTGNPVVCIKENINWRL